jgi:FkbM family methyltransferase
MIELAFRVIMSNPARRLAGRAKRQILKFFALDRFLRHCTGVIHVGANSGQERQLYAQYGLHVVWIEALDEPFEALKANISAFPNQIAIQALVTNRNGDRHVVHVANNEGASSSILEFNQVNDIWPDIHYVRDVEMQSMTLPAALEGIDLAPYDALIMDTQGTELLILEGATPLLPRFKFIKTEAADFELYKNCAVERDNTSFLRTHGFRVKKKEFFAAHPRRGRCFDLLFKRA